MSLVAFKILSSVFSSSVMIYMGMVFFVYPGWVCWVSWIYKLISFTKFGKFSGIISSNIFSALILSFGTPVLWMASFMTFWYHFISFSDPGLFFGVFFFFNFSSFCFSDWIISLHPFSSPLLPLYHFHSTIEPFQWNFIFII